MKPSSFSRSLAFPLAVTAVLLATAATVFPALLKWLQIGGALSATFLIRYLVIAGLAYLVFYIWKPGYWQHRRIQAKFPAKTALRQEIEYSLSTFLIFGLIGIGIYEARQHGLTLIYTDIADYGWGYLLFSVVVALVLHDAYFYWTHRLMHHKRLFPLFHQVHHLSHNPSPWASFSFHPLEAVVEGAILPLLVFTLPMHPLAILLFLLVMTVMNVIGHLGYELYPASLLKHPLGKLNNTSTHHNLHHRFGKGNYGLYFNWWDRWMGTNHVKYESTFADIASRKRNREQVAN